MKRRWSVVFACLLAAACTSADPQADEIQAAVKQGWHVVQLHRVESVRKPDARIDNIVRLSGTASAPLLTVGFDNPCGSIPIFAYRVLTPGELHMRTLGSLARTEVCPAVWAPEIRTGAIVPLAPTRCARRSSPPWPDGGASQPVI